MTEDKQRRIDSLFELWRIKDGPGGQVLIKKNGAVIYERCFGYAGIEFEAPVTVSTKFNIASNSKQFTVTAALMLMEQGLLRVDDDIREYIPELVAFDGRVTVNQLMTHTSGIRDVCELLVQSGRRADDTVTQSDALKLISMQTGLCFEPGSRYMYSNSNFVCLAAIVEKLSGMTLPQFLKARVFDRLGMKDTLVEDRYWILIPDAAVSYYDNGRAFLHSVFNSGFYGDGNIWTTARDFSIWLENQYVAPKLLRPETIRFMQTLPEMPEGVSTFYARGLVLGSVGGHRIVTHGGTDACFRSQFGLLPDDGCEIIVFSNTNNLSPEHLVASIAGILLDVPEETEGESGYLAGAVSASDAVGFYYGTGADQMMLAEVYENDGRLYMRDNYEGIELQHQKGNLYRVGRSAMNLYLGDRPCIEWLGEIIPAKKADTVADAAHFGEYCGEYECAELLGARYTVRIEGERMLFTHRRLGDMYMAPLEEKDCFLLDLHLENAMILRFRRDTSGRICGFTMSGGECRGIPFTLI